MKETERIPKKGNPHQDICELPKAKYNGRVAKMVLLLFSQKSESHVQLFATPWTVTCQASVHGILQARILEWVAIPNSRRPS